MNLYCSSKHVETAEGFSTQNSHFDIYFHLKERWKIKTRLSFLVKCPWTKWAVFYKKKKKKAAGPILFLWHVLQFLSSQLISSL